MHWVPLMPELLHHREGAIATLLLNRPERRNTITHTLLLELSQALLDCERDPEVRVVILSGAGSTFCAGLDLDDAASPAGIESGGFGLGPTLDRRLFPPCVLYHMDTPTLCAINPCTVNTQFAEQVVVPGFIAQHDHPLLAALTMTSEIIAIEDWVLPDGTRPAAKNRDDYLKKLAAANARMKDPSELLLTWGYHHYFHGKLAKADLDAISATRPIIVWHRSAHEFYLNSAAEKKFGVTKAWWDKLPESAQQQSDFANGHYWEQGWFAVLPLTAAAVASPARLRAGLELVKSYCHANGVTLGAEPGGIAEKKAQDAQNAVLSDSSSPFRFYFIADGKSITGAFPDEKVGEETEKLLSWGHGMTAYLPKQVKLFADGAIYSQAMQVTAGYKDGHRGEWLMDPDFFARTFRVYWDLGYQLHVHVNGDAGLDMVLDQFEQNMRRAPRHDHRTVIVHFAVSRPEQAPRGDRQRQPVLPGGARRQLPQQRPRSGTGRCDGADGRRRKCGNLLLVPLGHADGAGTAAVPDVVRGQSHHQRRQPPRARTAREPARRVEGRDPRRGVLDATGEGGRQHRVRQARQLHHPGRQPTDGRSDEDQGHPGLGHGARGQGHSGQGGRNIAGDRRRRWLDGSGGCR